MGLVVLLQNPNPNIFTEESSGNQLESMKKSNEDKASIKGTKLVLQQNFENQCLKGHHLQEFFRSMNLQ